MMNDRVVRPEALSPRELGAQLASELAAGPAAEATLAAARSMLATMDDTARIELLDTIARVDGHAVRRLTTRIAADPVAWAPLLAIPLGRAASDDATLAALVDAAIRGDSATAVGVLHFVRAAVEDRYGDFKLAKPCGVWPSMPLFAPLHAALVRGDAAVREAVLRVPGPWSWTPDERTQAAKDARDDAEADLIASFELASATRASR